MFRISAAVLIALVSVNTFAASPSTATEFQGCFDHGNEGAAPANAKYHYSIQRPGIFPLLEAVDPKDLEGQKVFKLIIEDVRFTNYKCWDADGNLTGFDIEMMTQAIFAAGYWYVEFVPRAWTSVQVEATNQPSLLVDLNNGLGDAVAAGMSITPERAGYVDMIGPIYKAGKVLMARKDNPKLSDVRLAALQALPGGDYSALKGLTVLTSSGDIRGAFFRKLKEIYPEWVEYLVVNEEGTDFVPIENEAGKLLVYETDFPATNALIESQMKAQIFGRGFDLVMIDTGSILSLTEDGKLGLETQVVTGNLALDAQLGSVFGQGDGVSFRKSDTEMSNNFREILAAMVRIGRINQLVRKWFDDENSADHGWANP